MGLDRGEIADQLRHDIRTGKYLANTKLPSYRLLAKMLGSAPNTVGEAVRTLAAEGLVKIKPRGRVVVCPLDEAEGAHEGHNASVREELGQVHVELQEVRARVEELDERVSELLTRLDE